jgi:hypothetical protein
MKDQVADAVSEDKGITPELFFGERINPFVEFARTIAVLTRKSIGNGLVQGTHEN